jgi:hypothetical protein
MSESVFPAVKVEEVRSILTPAAGVSITQVLADAAISGAQAVNIHAGPCCGVAVTHIETIWFKEP